MSGAGFYRFPALGNAEAERCQAATHVLTTGWPEKTGHSVPYAGAGRRSGLSAGRGELSDTTRKTWVALLVAPFTPSRSG